MQMIITIPRISLGFFSKETSAVEIPKCESRRTDIHVRKAREKTNKRLAEGVILQ